MNWIDHHSQVDEVSLLQTKRSALCFLQTISCCVHSLNRDFNMHVVSWKLR